MDDFWIIDTDTYQQLQSLKLFIKFVSGLGCATSTDKKTANEIIYLLENINRPNSFKSWNVCLDIFDRHIIDSSEKLTGFYWRSWSVYFENNTLEIEAKSRHTEDDHNHYGDDFYYYTWIDFKKEVDWDRISMSEPIDNFIADAYNYEAYITESLKDVEIEMEIWNKK